MRQITIDLSRCQPRLVCDQIVPGLRARIEKSGGAPLQVHGWAWPEWSGWAVVDDWLAGNITVPVRDAALVEPVE